MYKIEDWKILLSVGFENYLRKRHKFIGSKRLTESINLHSIAKYICKHASTTTKDRFGDQEEEIGGNETTGKTTRFRT